MKLELYIELIINFSMQTNSNLIMNKIMGVQCYKSNPLWRIQVFKQQLLEVIFRCNAMLIQGLCDLASYLLPYVTFIRLLDIRPIKGLRHGHASSLAPRRDFSNQLEHLLTLPTRQKVSCLVWIGNSEQGCTWIRQWKIPKTLLWTCNLRLNIIGAFLDVSPGKSPTLFIDKTEPRDKALILMEH